MACIYQQRQVAENFQISVTSENSTDEKRNAGKIYHGTRTNDCRQAHVKSGKRMHQRFTPSELSRRKKSRAHRPVKIKAKQDSTENRHSCNAEDATEKFSRMVLAYNEMRSAKLQSQKMLDETTRRMQESESYWSELDNTINRNQHYFK